jgi:hypothetical protein
VKHDTPEELKRAIRKLQEKLDRQRLRSKKLRILLDTRTKKMISLWGALEDIRRDVEAVAPGTKPGYWRALVRSVRRLVNEHVAMRTALGRDAVRAALQEEVMKEEQEKAPGLFRSVWNWLQTKRRI